MKSGIFAVVNIGELQLYVGEVHHLHKRWERLMMLFHNGKFPHSQLQETWNQKGNERRFTFHTADEIATNHKILGKKQFLTDVDISTKSKS